MVRECRTALSLSIDGAGVSDGIVGDILSDKPLQITTDIKTEIRKSFRNNQISRGRLAV